MPKVIFLLVTVAMIKPSLLDARQCDTACNMITIDAEEYAQLLVDRKEMKWLRNFRDTVQINPPNIVQEATSLDYSFTNRFSSFESKLDALRTDQTREEAKDEAYERHAPEVIHKSNTLRDILIGAGISTVTYALVSLATDDEPPIFNVTNTLDNGNEITITNENNNENNNDNRNRNRNRNDNTNENTFPPGMPCMGNMCCMNPMGPVDFRRR